eukprot:TRINITY_DN2808_c0_g1_i1.p1 TRINITY_DN2808_c0_g1~~TRINITY_DN2808_c0_g1_i1.p1  ORF type:complete len:328 (-),score=62.27 TRINITY_DN2808_c0_g1_i1:888-1871(-)
MQFRKEWVVNLRSALKSYLDEVLPSLEEPLLCKVWESYKKTARVTQSATIEKFDPLKEKYGKLKEDYRIETNKREMLDAKIAKTRVEGIETSDSALDIAKKLLTALELLKKQTIPKEFLELAESEIDKYDAYFSEGAREARKEKPKKQALKMPKEKIKSIEKIESIKSEEIADARPEKVESAKLDYGKLKGFMLTSPDTLKICAILQALKYRISNARSTEAKNTIIAEYVQADLLYCNKDARILERLLKNSDKKYLPCLISRIVECSILFIDEMVANHTGSRYLLGHYKTVMLLGTIIEEEVHLTLNVVPRKPLNVDSTKHHRDTFE